MLNKTRESLASLLALVQEVAQKIAQKRWFPGALLSTIALLCFVLEAAPFLSIERSYFAFLSSLKNTSSTGGVAVVGLDDYSRSVYGPSPRREVAEAIRALSKMGAKTVALALEFPQEDNAPALSEFRLISNTIVEDEALMKIKAVRGIRSELEKAGKRVDADEALLKALKVRVKLVFPMYFGFDGKDGITPPDHISEKALLAEPPVRWPGNIGEDMGKFKNPLHLLNNPVPTAGSIEYPFDALSSKARAFGHVNVLEDTDGVVRKHHLMIEYAGKLYPSLALRLALRHSGVYLSEYEGMFRDRGVEGMGFGDLTVPSDSDFGMLYGTTDLPPVYTLASLLRGTAPEGAFKGKAVVLGDVSRYAKRYITHDG
ncbi:MAG: CHASE2 domain-containing protein, partial [Thermodesulfovibrionales bacterium]|nr:CHASE2 domain-containing protein [Thermodesulfovibrionales bacterium]